MEINHPKTERIFDADSYVRNFSGHVLSCIKSEDKYNVILDRTVFFPEEGGQDCDIGWLETKDGIKVNVVYVYEDDGIIVHICDGGLCIDSDVHGEIDFSRRYSEMQNHTGEHIISGIVYNNFGFENVGFHLGQNDMTLDFSGELNNSQLLEIEQKANEKIYACLPVSVCYPDEEVLSGLNYRSKKQINGKIRIIEIKDTDICACCAPHVRNTGEIGIIKILDSIRYKGGTRIHVLCGSRALEDYRQRYNETYKISSLLSSKQYEVADGVEKLMSDISNLRSEIFAAKKKLYEYKAHCMEYTDGNICLFEDEEDMNILRLYANEAVKKCSGMCALFSGSDNTGYKYIIESRTVNLKTETNKINNALCGRGGGSSEMLTGSCRASKETIMRFFSGMERDKNTAQQASEENT